MTVKKQKGGDLMNSITSGLSSVTNAIQNEMPMTGMPNEAKSPFMNQSELSDLPEMYSGGAKKSKKSKSKKTTEEKPKTKKTKKGGALVDDMKNLAVPFAILLAKQGLQVMFDKKNTEQNAEISASTGPSKKSASKKSASKKSTSKKQLGGDCTSCADVVVKSKAGGAKSKLTRYAQLSKEIDNFLAKY